MRIKSNFSSRDIDSNTKNKSSLNNFSSIKSDFYTAILQNESVIDEYEKEISGLRKEIEEAGGKLEKEPTIPNFKHFRETLSKLAKRITKEAYRLEKYGGTSQSPRYYEIITTINYEADKLYNLIIHDQKNNMAITAKVIGIKGLVVDLIS